MAAEWSGCRIEHIFRVQTVKLVGPGLSSTSPERRRKARRKKNYDSAEARTSKE